MNDSEIIVALGDTGVVAKTLGLGHSRVSNWKSRGIAWRYRPAIVALAKKKRVPIPPEFLTA